MNELKPSAHLNLPYPPIAVEGPNPAYARAMLDNAGGRNSEMSAVSIYFYNHIITAQEEVAAMFHDISIVEMHHLEIFAELAMLLGEDPRLWTQTGNCKTYWSGNYLRYSASLPQLLRNAISAEEDAIEKYQGQLQTIGDRYIRANLQRIIRDEELHIEILSDLYHRYATDIEPPNHFKGRFR